MAEPRTYAWGVVHHLLGVSNTPALRAAEQEVQPDVVRAVLRLAQSKPLYQALQDLRDGPDWAGLNGPQQRIVESGLRSARLAGVALEGEAQARFSAIEM